MAQGESAPSVRVFLVDDHELVRQGLKDVIEDEAEHGDSGDTKLEVVGEASTAREALTRIRATSPDVVVLDIHLPDGSGIQVCREIRSEQPSIRCLILSAYQDEESMLEAVIAGAAGYLRKTARGREVVSAIRAVAMGQKLLDPELATKALDRFRNPTGVDALTTQESKVLDGISRGLTNREIGRELHLAEKTVKNYVTNLLRKLGFEHRTQAAIYVVRKTTEEGVTPPE